VANPIFQAITLLRMRYSQQLPGTAPRYALLTFCSLTPWSYMRPNALGFLRWKYQPFNTLEQPRTYGLGAVLRTFLSRVSMVASVVSQRM
jgi:hypothetical protein